MRSLCTRLNGIGDQEMTMTQFIMGRLTSKDSADLFSSQKDKITYMLMQPSVKPGNQHNLLPMLIKLATCRKTFRTRC